MEKYRTITKNGCNEKTFMEINISRKSYGKEDTPAKTSRCKNTKKLKKATKEEKAANEVSLEADVFNYKTHFLLFVFIK